jgi:hypothetical protein
MSKNNVIVLNRIKDVELTPEKIQAEVDDLYDELEKQYGVEEADVIMLRYTDVQPRQRGERSLNVPKSLRGCACFRPSSMP